MTGLLAHTPVEYHQPVMVGECLDWLMWRKDGLYADATLGGGGHSEAILQRLDAQGRLVSFDRDPEAISYACARLSDARWEGVHAPFSQMATRLPAAGVDGILMDLGVSSHQLDAAERGFSWRRSETVDLRMNPADPTDAHAWLLGHSVEEVAAALRDNADLSHARRWAEMLKGCAEAGPALLMKLLEVEAKRTAGPRAAEELLPRVLQALRMEVNEEMLELRQAIDAARALLVSGGRLVVLTYHSVEDRVVKHRLRELEQDCLCPPRQPVCTCGGKNGSFTNLFRNPVVASAAEVVRNPRARSAKLRVFARR